MSDSLSSAISSVLSPSAPSVVALSALKHWEQSIRSQLLPFLHSDVIHIVLVYAAIIHFSLLRVIGGQLGSGDGELHFSYGIVLMGMSCLSLTQLPNSSVPPEHRQISA